MIDEDRWWYAVLEGVSPTESGLLNAYFADEPLAQVFEKIEICASTPNDSTGTIFNSISVTEL